MEIGSLRSALRVLEFSSFESGNGARVLAKALGRLERAAEAPNLTRIATHQLESSLLGTQAVLQRASAAGVGAGVTTHVIDEGYTAAGTLLEQLRSGTFDARRAVGLVG